MTSLLIIAALAGACAGFLVGMATGMHITQVAYRKMLGGKKPGLK